MIMQVHDELVFEVPDDELDWAREAVPRIMAGVATLAVPLRRRGRRRAELGRGALSAPQRRRPLRVCHTVELPEGGSRDLGPLAHRCSFCAIGDGVIG